MIVKELKAELEKRGLLEEKHFGNHKPKINNVQDSQLEALRMNWYID